LFSLNLPCFALFPPGASIVFNPLTLQPFPAFPPAPPRGICQRTPGGIYSSPHHRPGPWQSPTSHKAFTCPQLIANILRTRPHHPFAQAPGASQPHLGGVPPRFPNFCFSLPMLGPGLPRRPDFPASASTQLDWGACAFGAKARRTTAGAAVLPNLHFCLRFPLRVFRVFRG
jgi:hypothetical protein